MHNAQKDCMPYTSQAQAIDPCVTRPLGMQIAHSLREAQGETLNWLDMLEARLAHCLSQQTQDAEGQPKPTYASELAREFDDCVDRQGAITSRIRNLIDRIAV
jgi:hypothetical protein